LHIATLGRVKLYQKGSKGTSVTLPELGTPQFLGLFVTLSSPVRPLKCFDGIISRTSQTLAAMTTSLTNVCQPVSTADAKASYRESVASLSTAGTRSHNATQSSPEAQRFAAASSVCWED